MQFIEVRLDDSELRLALFGPFANLPSLIGRHVFPEDDTRQLLRLNFRFGA
jgi:hypothetical protein